jgi:short-chain fatty acids transporter
MLSILGVKLDRFARRYTPDPLVFAILLTLVSMGLCIILTGHSFGETINYWYEGFWNLFTFGMQMCLILVTGHALATAPIIQRFLNRLASIPHNQPTAIGLVAIVAGIASLMNWGLGLIVGALFAVAVAKTGKEKGYHFHYPLLGAAAYGGFLLWHCGISGSIPLALATPENFLAKEIGIIPASQTLFSNLNVLVVFALFITIPLVAIFVRPRSKSSIKTIAVITPELLEGEETLISSNKTTSAARLEHNQYIAWIIGGIGIGFTFWHFVQRGLVNLFVPSGGGQWAVQGPIMVEAEKSLSVPLTKTTMAVAYGDSWTNMLQPFWALALLGITRLKAGAIVGYTMLIMLVTGIVISGLLYFLSLSLEA